MLLSDNIYCVKRWRHFLEYNLLAQRFIYFLRLYILTLGELTKNICFIGNICQTAYLFVLKWKSKK